MISRRTAFALAALVAASGLSGHVAGAQTGADPGASSGQVIHSWVLTPAGTGAYENQASRSAFTYEMAPGAVLDDALTVANLSNVPLTFRLYPTDAVNNADGQFDLLPPSEDPTDVGTWVSIAQENITLGPREQATVPIVVRVPDDARPGDHAGAILASSQALGSGPDGKVVNLDRRTGSRIYLRVTGELAPDLVIEDVDTSYSPALNPLGGRAEVRYRIRNRGNVRLSGSHQASVGGPFGVGRRSSERVEITELLPGESQDVAVTIDGVPATGLAFTKIDLDPEPVDGGGELDASDRSASSLDLAVPVTILLGAAMTGLAAFGRRRFRLHRVAPDVLADEDRPSREHELTSA